MSKSFVAASIVAVVAASSLHTREFYESAFHEHTAKFGLKFENGAEFVKRLEVFISNFDMIETHNSQANSFQMGLNQFSHLTFEEFQASIHNGYVTPTLRSTTGQVHSAPLDASALPASVDWSTTGAVSAVKNQGSCGSCWSFSTTGGVEGAYFVKTGKATSLSEQQLVSCDKTNFACNGGLMDTAFSWVNKNGGLCTEASYPYVSGNGNVPACQSSCSEVSGTDVSDYVDVQTNSVNALMSAVAQQPVSIAIQANQMAFQSYSSGVLTGKCGQNLDHGVLLVGYGTWTDGTPYWKVKNSWGTSWGMNGYILIERSSDDLCGVLDAPSYSVV
jgi:cathepsin L